MPTDESRLAPPLTVPCVARTLRLLVTQVRRCPSVRKAWISTFQDGTAEPNVCVVIELTPGVPDEQEVLRSIVDPLRETAPEGIVRDELMAFAWFVADDGMQAELSDGAGVAIYP
jgi:hypothetical protein